MLIPAIILITRGPMVLYRSPQTRFQSEWPLTKIKERPWPLIHVYLYDCTHLVYCIYQLLYHRLKYFLSNPSFTGFALGFFCLFRHFCQFDFLCANFFKSGPFHFFASLINPMIKVISCNPDMLSSGEKINDNTDWTVQKRALIQGLKALWT